MHTRAKLWVKPPQLASKGGSQRGSKLQAIRTTSHTLLQRRACGTLPCRLQTGTKHASVRPEVKVPNGAEMLVRNKARRSRQQRRCTVTCASQSEGCTNDRTVQCTLLPLPCTLDKGPRSGKPTTATNMNVVHASDWVAQARVTWGMPPRRRNSATNVLARRRESCAAMRPSINGRLTRTVKGPRQLRIKVKPKTTHTHTCERHNATRRVAAPAPPHPQCADASTHSPHSRATLAKH